MISRRLKLSLHIFSYTCYRIKKIDGVKSIMGVELKSPGSPDASNGDKRAKLTVRDKKEGLTVELKKMKSLLVAFSGGGGQCISSLSCP